MSFGAEKALVRSFFAALQQADADNTVATIQPYLSPNHQSYLSYPWRKLQGAEALATEFWRPLMASFTALQRREDIFFAGVNTAANSAEAAVWVVSMGHYMGLFDQAWLNIPANGRTTTIRFAEFHEVRGGKIARTGLFVDLIGVMRQAGFDPLPNETGHHFVYPGPATHDGVLLDEQHVQESQETADLVERMVQDLNELNLSGNDLCPPEILARTWHDDMVWYGPAGIGATHTIARYQQQHQYPFRTGLTNKEFNGHVARIAEGNYAGFFGWPNLRNSPNGFLGVPASDVHAEMQVVDIYRRQGDKLAENWVIIDLPYWLAQLGIDVFACLEQTGTS